MAEIDKSNFTSNLDQSLYDYLKATVGTSYIHPKSGTKTIKYIVGYPSDFKEYVDDIPLIVIQRLGKTPNGQAEMGGKRKVSQGYYIHVIAGGYNKDSHNEFMKNGITDLIDFGFDEKTFSYKDYSSSPASVITQIKANSTVLDTSRRDKINIFESHHSIISIDLELWVYNN